jgi:hypothetical protein
MKIIQERSDLDHLRYEFWRAVVSIESEERTLTAFESVSKDLATEMTTFRDIVQPGIALVGVPLLEEYSKSFQKVLFSFYYTLFFSFSFTIIITITITNYTNYTNHKLQITFIFITQKFLI